MEAMETKAVDRNKDGVSESTNISTNKIALMPFTEAGCGVHVLDAEGNTFPVRQDVPMSALHRLTHSPRALVSCYDGVCLQCCL